jgi:DNA-directed RNA polymerase specialized sigma24 family protein
MYLRNEQYEQYSETQGLFIVEKETEWLTTIEASEIMGIKPKTIANYCSSGKLECRKFGRDWQVSRASAIGFVKSNVGRPKIDKT